MEYLLKEVVAPKEILEYLEHKYETEGIVTPKTIRNWQKNLGIECIKPTPSKNADRRYKRSDVLKMEAAKKEKLKNIQHARLLKSKKENIARKSQTTQNEVNEYYINSMNSSEKDKFLDDLDISYSIEADKIIKQDMLEKCFEKLFPNYKFDKEGLKKNLYIMSSTTIASNEEKGAAIDFIEKKRYMIEDV